MLKFWITRNGYKVVRVLNGRSNAYLIIKDQYLILIDTGKENSYATLQKNFLKINQKIENINILILTHTHFDHCQSAKMIQDVSNCQIVVSRHAEDSIRNGYAELPKGTFVITKIISRLGSLIGKRIYGFQKFKPTIFVDDAIDLKYLKDSEIRIIETAGHSDDSVSVLIDNEIAIVGDAMFGIFKNSIFPPFSDDCNKMVESWGELLNTTCDLFLPGHGGAINRDLLKSEHQKYIQKYVY